MTMDIAEGRIDKYREVYEQLSKDNEEAEIKKESLLREVEEVTKSIEMYRELISPFLKYYEASVGERVPVPDFSVHKIV